MLTIAILLSSSKHVNRPLCLHKQLARPVKPGCQNMHNPGLEILQHFGDLHRLTSLATC